MDSHGASSEDSSSLSAFKITQQRGVDHLHAHVSDQLYTRIKRFSFYTVYAAASGRHYARFAMMELVKVVLIVVLLLTNVFCQELDYDSWREGIAEVRLLTLNLSRESMKRIGTTYFHTKDFGTEHKIT